MIKKSFVNLSVLQVLTLLLISVVSSTAAEYYVSPSGSASWIDCTTQSSPCHPHTALDNVSAGDTVYFMDGTYSVTKNHTSTNYRVPLWAVQVSGTSGNPITLKSLNLHGAHLHVVDSSLNPAMIGAYSEDYIVWEGFYLTSETSGGTATMAKAQYYSSNNSTFKNLKMRGGSHSDGGSYNREGIRLEGSTYITVDGCYLYDYRETSNNHNNGALKTYNVDNLTIKNSVFENSTNGIYIKGSPHKTITIENNWIKDNHEGFLMSVHLNAPNEDVSLINNVFSGQAESNYLVDFRDSEDGVEGNGFLVRNNTFSGGERGFMWYGAATGEGPEIYNNIFANSSGYSLKSNRDDAAPAVSSDHNLVVANNVAQMRWSWGEATMSTYDTLTSWQSSDELYGGGNPGTGSITGDPLFVNASGSFNSLDDFRLAPYSPAIGAGRNGVNMGADIDLVGPGNTVTDDQEITDNQELFPPLGFQLVETVGN